ncbi:hypothetical protein DFH09DRAFT_1208940 [Mycena vulgaris]|nr:hypothetical protein DFH09DRAFT_1208940 [Mycena vulgaris]
MASSLLELPTEILTEIIAYHPDPFTVCSPLLRQEHGVQERGVRRLVLRALSQSSSRLRSIFLPLLWEQFHASAAQFQQKYITSEFVTLIFPHIKSVHVSMKSWSLGQMETIFLLVEFLCELPTLAGFQICDPPPTIMPIIRYAFKDAVFPTVASLCVPDWLAPAIFDSFPNVTTLACPSIYAHSDALVFAKRHFPRLEALAGLRLSKDLIDDLVRDFPNLRAISVSSTAGRRSAVLPMLKRFKALARLSLVHEDSENLLSREALVNGGAEVLLASESPEAKVLTVWSYNVYEGFHLWPRIIWVA